MTKRRRIQAITVETAQTRTRPEAAAADLLKRCLEFYMNPENERDFEEWKKKKGR